MRTKVSTLIKRPLTIIPKKCKDPGIFFIPYIIGNNKFDNVMLDLGASINVMHLSVFTSLSLGSLKAMSFAIQMANRSIVQSAKIVKDVLVKVNNLVFPTDIYVLNMKGGDTPNENTTTIILDKPFLKTTRTKIDVHACTLTIEFGDNLV